MLSYAMHLINNFFDCFSINHRVLLLDPRFNARHGQTMPVVYRMGNYQLAEEMTWGLIPFWNKNQQSGSARLGSLLYPTSSDNNSSSFSLCARHNLYTLGFC
jgi:hypothetical protein